MIDYEKILKAYIEHVSNMEGVDFLSFATAADMDGLTEAEFDALWVAAGRDL